EFKLDAKDRPTVTPASGTSSASATSPGSETPPPDAGEPGVPVTAGAATAGTLPLSGDLRALENSLRAMVREELKSQLGPINRELAEASRDQSPTLKEVAGGLGWVVGVTGVVFWARGRRPAKSVPEKSGTKD
ncbi:MAG: hypothetical protein LBF41_09705, partial [Deltaproteobacteria bacterium]|nr:hypothetical protein [Deltaproteobacteria bacterium]